jgi:Ca2+-binding RTX toxin-like protein
MRPPRVLRRRMRFAPGSLIAALLLLLFFLPSPVQAAAASAPPPASCAAGPTTAGDTILGTPCADRIVVPAAVERVNGGGGDDTILAAPIAAAVPCAAVCLGVGSQTFEGGPGNDVVFGERGNDILRGGAGDDRLYGGIGDDLLEGGPGNDLLAGGFGADTIDGQEGDDYVRGDGTIDHIHDSGGGSDTLSYASGVTPGFGGGIATGAANFPAGEGGERGVYLNLGAPGLNGNNGIAGEGGGVDEVELGSFETVIGTAFPDYIVGGAAGETIYGGGGADVILGSGGEDRLVGGADGDYLDGGSPGANSIDGGPGTDNCVNPTGAAGAAGCEGTSQEVKPRDPGKVSVGLMAPGAPGPSQLYLTGSSAGDSATASYAPGTVTFALSGASFDTSAAVPGCAVSPASASCAVGALDSIVLAGLGGADSLTAPGFPQETGVVVLGGEGADTLSGGEGSEDLLVDGLGADKDVLSALGRDDALLHNGGPDQLLGGDGNDLFLSVSICDGETLSGGEGRDNASWARLGNGEGVEARLDAGLVGRFGAAGDPGCSGEAPDSLLSVEDLEGSEAADALFGDPGPNQLLGHKGPDEYFAAAGEDLILANSADSDPAIDCGADLDTAVLDVPTAKYADATPVGCEVVRFGAPEEFRTVTELPPAPLPPPPPPPPPPPVDRTAPRTKVTAHPAKLLRTSARHRRVVFRFSSSERGSHFRCKLDAKPFRACASPRPYTVALGKHTVRIVAIDAAGNADPTPAKFSFRVRQR